MFRDMRRSAQALSEGECEAVLERGTSGVLAVSGDDGYPYAVPLSYVYDGPRIVFHCAGQGAKLDALARCEKVSFCVVDLDQVVPSRYTTYFRSVIVFGHTRILADAREKREALELLAAKYSPDDEVGRLREVADTLERVCIVEIAIDHMTGKQARELMRR